MTHKDELQERLWGTNLSPFSNFPAGLYAVDIQGWNSGHRYLSETIRERSPKTIVEVGVWKGGSVITMAKELSAQGYGGAIIAVDTWLGSWEHWGLPERFKDLRMVHGYPHLYYTFMANCIHVGVQDHILPLPADSSTAYHVLSKKGIRPDLVHIDAGHDFESVYADLTRWYELLVDGGTIICDDYDPTGRVWPSVGKAVNKFVSEVSPNSFEHSPYKCRFMKPVEPRRESN